MAGYLQNNYNMIKMYRKLYKDEMSIDHIKYKILEGEFDNIPLSDFYRFRVFLDSCLLLFNKEKIEKDYFKGAFMYKNFMDNYLKKESNREILDRCEEIVNRNCGLQINTRSSKFFFYSFLSEENSTVYKHLQVLRNSFAHMQYGNFAMLEDGPLVYYGIYNKDKNIKKDMGIVIDPILHDFIKAFFSNNMIYGVPYKHTFIIDDSVQSVFDMSFCEVRYISDKDNRYEGFGNHIMKEVVFSQNNRTELTSFLGANSDKLTYKETKIPIEQYNDFKDLVTKELGRNPFRNEILYTIKAFYDIETEFSNYLIHLIQLNDRIIDYKSISDSGNKKRVSDIMKSVDELKEDKDSWFIFKIFSVLLECINVILRLEDDDLSIIEKRDINIDGFTYKNENLVDYINTSICEGRISEQDATFGDKYYALERFRNALAHGNIRLDLKKENKENKVKINFVDMWNKREEQVKIEFDKLCIFLSDNNWYLDK